MDKKTERLQLRLSKQELAILKILAAQKGITRSEYICAYLRRNARKAKLI